MQRLTLIQVPSGNFWISRSPVADCGAWDSFSFSILQHTASLLRESQRRLSSNRYSALWSCARLFNCTNLVAEELASLKHTVAHQQSLLHGLVTGQVFWITSVYFLTFLLRPKRATSMTGVARNTRDLQCSAWRR